MWQGVLQWDISTHSLTDENRLTILYIFRFLKNFTRIVFLSFFCHLDHSTSLLKSRVERSLPSLRKVNFHTTIGITQIMNVMKLPHQLFPCNQNKNYFNLNSFPVKLVRRRVALSLHRPRAQHRPTHTRVRPDRVKRESMTSEYTSGTGRSSSKYTRKKTSLFSLVKSEFIWYYINKISGTAKKLSYTLVISGNRLCV